MVYHNDDLGTWEQCEHREMLTRLIDTQVWQKFADCIGLSHGGVL
jgi:hypothetical protein